MMRKTINGLKNYDKNEMLLFVYHLLFIIIAYKLRVDRGVSDAHLYWGKKFDFDQYQWLDFANYGTNLTRIPYKGDYNDAAIYLFNPVANQGVLFGNEVIDALPFERFEVTENGPMQLGVQLDESGRVVVWVSVGAIFCLC